MFVHKFILIYLERTINYKRTRHINLELLFSCAVENIPTIFLEKFVHLENSQHVEVKVFLRGVKTQPPYLWNIFPCPYYANNVAIVCDCEGMLKTHEKGKRKKKLGLTRNKRFRFVNGNKYEDVTRKGNIDSECLRKYFTQTSFMDLWRGLMSRENSLENCLMLWNSDQSRIFPQRF